MWFLTRSSSRQTDTHPWKPLHRLCSRSLPARRTKHGYGVNRWRLCESNDPETPPAIYRRLLPSFLARSGCCIELILIRRDRLRFYGSKWATPLPQRRVRRSRVPNNPSLRDVFEISQEHQRSGQRVLLSICGYSLALDAGRKNFLSDTGPGKTISFSSVRQDCAPISQSAPAHTSPLLRWCNTHNATVRLFYVRCLLRKSAGGTPNLF
jgi:hypothetical protein